MNKTLECLAKAFVGESMARNRYTIYAKQAVKEGFEQIAGVFLETAEQERVHAKKLFEAIQEIKKKTGETAGEIGIDGVTGVPTVFGSTKENLAAAIAGEHHEHEIMYPEFAKIADGEGFHDAAKRMRSIAVAEKHHEERYVKLLKQVEAGSVFKKPKAVWWVCRECGYMHFGTTPPEKCPACEHPTAFYQLKCEEY